MLVIKLFYNKVPVSVADMIIEWGDCMSLTLLSEFPIHQSKVIGFADRLNKKDLYELDNYWLLLYQLYSKGKIKRIYTDTTFNVLKKHKVSFIKF